MLHWLLHAVGRFLIQIRLSIISGIHHSILQMVFPEQESQKILYEIRNLPLAVVSDRKPGFIPLGCGTLQRHTTARVPITQWWKEAPQKRRCFSATSLQNLAWASTILKLPVPTPTKMRLSLNPSTKQVWSSVSPDTQETKFSFYHKTCKQ